MYKAVGILVVLAAFSAAACDEGLSEIAGPTPGLEPTFTSIMRDVIGAGDSTGRRPCVQCHTNDGGRIPAGLMNLNANVAYDQLVNARSTQRPSGFRVIPGDPENSYLVHKVEGRPGIVGLRMPFIPPYLSDGQILILKRWIAIGAPRN
jgi:hypothetical protein